MDRDRIMVGVDGSESSIAAFDVDNFAGGREEAKTAHGSRKVSVAVPGSVRCGRNRAGNRDMRERCQIVKCPPAFVERRGEFSVASVA